MNEPTIAPRSPARDGIRRLLRLHGGVRGVPNEHAVSEVRALAISVSGARGWSLPDLAERALEVSAEDQRDVRLAVLPPHQPFGEIEDLARVVGAIQILAAGV